MYEFVTVHAMIIFAAMLLSQRHYGLRLSPRSPLEVLI